MKRDSRAPLIVAIVLLLLPIVYVGSYLALVQPYGRLTSAGNRVNRHYRVDSWLTFPILFWPLEQVDRKVRPEIWDEELLMRRILERQRSGGGT